MTMEADESTSSFKVPTFDCFESHFPRRPYGMGAATGKPFPINDPFGLRRAVVPVFRRDPNGETLGAGTAFHVDGWGSLLTADHVVDHTREKHVREIAPNAVIEADITQSSHAAVLLSNGLTFGTIVIPEKCWAPIIRIDTIVQRHEDPMLGLRGHSPYRVQVDLAALKAELHPEAPPLHTLPVNFNWRPHLGEAVLAIGYPELDFVAMDNHQIRDYLQEGMFGVYGVITNIYPDGRDKTHPTPVFEVFADWRPGMSGGPVLNRHGHVVGVVSYSLPPSGNHPGVGYAVCFSSIPDASALTPFLDSDKPGYRRGYGVYRLTPWHLAAVTPSLESAMAAKATLDSDYQISRGSHKLGSDNFLTT